MGLGFWDWAVVTTLGLLAASSIAIVCAFRLKREQLRAGQDAISRAAAALSRRMSGGEE